MQKTFIILISFIFFFVLPPPPFVVAKDNQKGKHLPNPNWVHPENRKNYPGYEKRKQNKQSNVDWQYSTNRDNGNVRGGGTTEYNDYQPFYKPEKYKKAK